MIEVINPPHDIFSYVKDPANHTAIVNTVNTVGTMGKGLALQFKKRYPTMAAEYTKVCKAGKMFVGNVRALVDHKLSSLPLRTILLSPQ